MPIPHRLPRAWPFVLASRAPARAIRPRFAIPAVVLIAGVTLFAGRGAWAANTEFDVNNGQADLTNATGTTYKIGGTAGTGVGGTTTATVPSVTSDVTFDSGVAYNPAAFTLNSSQTFGSLNDLSTTALTIANTSTTGTGDTLTLGGAGDPGSSVPGSAAGDLLFVGTGASLTINTGAANSVTALGLVLGQSGNFDLAGTGAATIASVISDGGNAYSITKTGTGSLTLSGANTFSGGVSLQAGTVFAKSAAAFGTGALSLGASSGTAGALVNYNGGSNLTVTNAINVNAGSTGTLEIEATSGAPTLAGLVTLSNNLLLVNTNSAGANSLNVTGGIAGTGNVTFTATSAGGSVISGTALTFTGTLANTSTGGAGFGVTANMTGAESFLQNSASSTTTLSGTNSNTGTDTVALGTLEFAKEVSLFNQTTPGTLTATASNLIVGAGATAAFEVGNTGGFTAADIAALNALGTSTGGFENGSRLGIDTTGGNLTLATAITNSNGGANVIGLTKLGANTLTLTGANTYSGATIITAGTLQLGTGATGNDGSISNSPSVADAGTLAFNLFGAQTYAGSIGGGGAVTKAGAGTLTLSGVNTYTGATTVTAGTLDLANSLALQNSTVTLSGTGALVFDSAVTSNAFTVGGLGGNPNIALQNNAATPAPITLQIGNPINNASTTTSGVFSGAGNLVFAGFSNTFTLTGANTYTGTTTVTGSTLNLGGAGANGSIGTGSNALALGGSASGGLFNYTRTGTVAQSFASTTIGAGENSVTTSTGTQTLNLGAITSTGGATLDINPNTTSAITTTSGNVNGIIGGFATYGGKTTFAVAPATSGGAITGLANGSYTETGTALNAPANYTAQNIDVNASATPTAAITPNSIRFNTATAYTLTLTGVNTITSGGILQTATASAGGTITGGTLTGSAGGQLSVTNGSGSASLSLSSLIVDNGTPTAVAVSGSVNGGYVNFYNINNSFSGGLYFNGGRLGFNSGGTPFGTGNVTFGNQVFTNSGGGGINFNGNNNITSGLLVDAQGTNASNGDIANGGTNTTGTWTLIGTPTSTASFAGIIGNYAGGRVVNLTLDSGTEIIANTEIGSSALTVNGGTFQVGNGFVGAYSNSANNVALNVGGGTFVEYGNFAGATAQPFNSGLVVNSGASTVTAVNNSGAGTLVSFAGAGSRAVGGTVNFALPAGVQSAVNGFTTVNLNTNGILGGYATVGGTDWATNATNAAGGNIIGLSASTINAYSANTFGTGLNTDVTTSGNGASTNSLRFNTAGANTLTFNGTNSIASGGILVTPNVGGTNATTLTGGTITGSAQDLVVIQNNPGANGALTISSTIGANGASGLTKSGPGVLILAPDPNGGGPNFFTGPLTINGGTVNLNQDGLGTAGSIVLNGGTFQANGAITGQAEFSTTNIGVVMGINGGTIDTTGGNVTLPGNVTNVAGNQFVGAGAVGGFNSTGVGALTVTGGGTVALGGAANAFGGGIVINNGTVQDASSSATSTTTLGTGYLTFGNNASPATVDLNGHNVTVAGLIGAGTNGLVTNNSAAASASVLTLNGVSNQTFSGKIQDGTVGTTAITLALSNPLAAQILTGANTYSGGTLVNVGTLLVNNAAGSGTGTGAVTVGNGTTLTGRLGGTGTIGGATTVNAGSAITGGTFGTVGMLTMTSTLNLNGTYSADLGTLGGSDRLVLSATGANGILAFGSTASLAFTGTASASTYILATYASDTGFNSLLTNSTSALPAGYSLVDTGTMLELTSVPEPSAWVSAVLGAFALVGTSLFRRSRRENLRDC